MKQLNVFDWVALVLAIIGAINWGLVGLLQLDLIAAIFGEMSILSRILYGLYGLAGIYLIFVIGMFRRK